MVSTCESADVGFLGPLTHPEILGNSFLRNNNELFYHVDGYWPRSVHNELNTVSIACTMQYSNTIIRLCSMNLSLSFNILTIHPLFGLPLLFFWSPCLSSKSLMGIQTEEVDMLIPDCIENSSKRHEEKSLNQGD